MTLDAVPTAGGKGPDSLKGLPEADIEKVRLQADAIGKIYHDLIEERARAGDHYLGKDSELRDLEQSLNSIGREVTVSKYKHNGIYYISVVVDDYMYALPLMGDDGEFDYTEEAFEPLNNFKDTGSVTKKLYPAIFKKGSDTYVLARKGNVEDNDAAAISGDSAGTEEDIYVESSEVSDANEIEVELEAIVKADKDLEGLPPKAIVEIRRLESEERLEKARAFFEMIQSFKDGGGQVSFGNIVLGDGSPIAVGSGNSTMAGGDVKIEANNNASESSGESIPENQVKVGPESPEPDSEVDLEIENGENQIPDLEIDPKVNDNDIEIPDTAQKEGVDELEIDLPPEYDLEDFAYDPTALKEARNRYLDELIEMRRLGVKKWKIFGGIGLKADKARIEEIGQEYYQAQSSEALHKVIEATNEQRTELTNLRDAHNELVGQFNDVTDRFNEINQQIDDAEGDEKLRLVTEHKDEREELEEKLSQLREKIDASTKQINDKREEINGRSAQEIIDDFLRTETAAVDEYITKDKSNEGVWHNFRQKWFSKGWKRARLGGGILLSIGGLLTPWSAAARSTMGAVGGAMFVERFLENRVGIGHRGLTDKLVKKFQKNNTNEADIKNEIAGLPKEDIYKEAFRLQAVQIERKTEIKKASLGQTDLDAKVIQLILDQRDTYLAERMAEKVAGEKAVVIMEQLDAELDDLPELEVGAVSRERRNRILRRVAGVGIGAGLGVVAGTRLFDLLDGDDIVPNIGGPDVEVPELSPNPDLANGQFESKVIGKVPIEINERGEGMIVAIAQHLEDNVDMDHDAAMALANKMFEVGEVTQGKEEMFNLVHVGDTFTINLGNLTAEQLQALDADTIKDLDPRMLASNPTDALGQIISGAFQQNDFVTGSGYAAGEELGRPGEFVNESSSSATPVSDDVIDMNTTPDTPSPDTPADVEPGVSENETLEFDGDELLTSDLIDEIPDKFKDSFTEHEDGYLTRVDENGVQISGRYLVTEDGLLIYEGDLEIENPRTGEPLFGSIVSLEDFETNGEDVWSDENRITPDDERYDDFKSLFEDLDERIEESNNTSEAAVEEVQNSSDGLNQVEEVSGTTAQDNGIDSVNEQANASDGYEPAPIIEDISNTSEIDDGQVATENNEVSGSELDQTNESVDSAEVPAETDNDRAELIDQYSPERWVDNDDLVTAFSELEISDLELPEQALNSSEQEDLIEFILNQSQSGELDFAELATDIDSADKAITLSAMLEIVTPKLLEVDSSAEEGIVLMQSWLASEQARLSGGLEVAQ